SYDGMKNHGRFPVCRSRRWRHRRGDTSYLPRMWLSAPSRAPFQRIMEREAGVDPSVANGATHTRRHRQANRTAPMTRGTADPIGELLTRGVDDLVFPGAVWAVGGPDGTRSWGATGLLDPADPRAPMAPDTVFDLASLTKIIVVWSTIGALWESGDIGLEDSLATHLPEVRGHDLADVTVIQLLTHTAGVPSRANLRALYGTDRSAIERGILHEPLSRPPGQTVEYTDRAALILGFLAERVAAMPLDELSRVCAWDALHMM